MSLAELTLNHGGAIKQLILPSNETGGMGVTNPSVFVDNNDKIYVNIRALNYILYHSESQSFYHLYGPLQYVHPEADKHLRTFNWFAELDDNLNIKWVTKIDFSRLDQPPMWDFVGLEDGRVIKVKDRFYLCGVRRDTTPNGQGRMELSEIDVQENSVVEVSRQRIPAPAGDISYCEKNWAPVLGKEGFEFVKWHHPVDVVKYESGVTSQVAMHDSHFFFGADLRGSSQVIPFNDGYLSVVHEVYLFKSELGSKNARYRHRFVHYDKDLRVVHVSKAFSFMDAEIEFCCGLAQKGEDLLISFGFQDNSAFILKMPQHLVKHASVN